MSCKANPQHGNTATVAAVTDGHRGDLASSLAASLPTTLLPQVGCEQSPFTTWGFWAGMRYHSHSGIFRMDLNPRADGLTGLWRSQAGRCGVTWVLSLPSEPGCFRKCRVTAQVFKDLHCGLGEMVLPPLWQRMTCALQYGTSQFGDWVPERGGKSLFLSPPWRGGVWVGQMMEDKLALALRNLLQRV